MRLRLSISSSDMKQFILRVALFVVFCVVAYPLWLLAWGGTPLKRLSTNLNYRRGSVGHMHTRLHEARNENDVDILFLGSSHAYRGFDTRIFAEAGLKTFNLGSSAQTPVQTELLLKRYLDRLNPKLIIYEVYPATFTSDGIESTTDLLSNDKIDGDIWAMVLDQRHMKSYHTALYATIRQTLFPDADFQEKRLRWDGRYISGGYVELNENRSKPKIIKKKRWTFHDYQYQAFSDALEFIADREIPVILIMAPIPAYTYESYLNMDEFNQKMHSYGSYYDFNQIALLDDQLHFYDTSHLNQEGVEVFNRDLIHHLEKQGVLPFSEQ